MSKLSQPQFFETTGSFHKWFLKYHLKAVELWVGFHKRDSGNASITWPESVEEALCFGWIDGVRKRIDDKRYVIRFTPRKPTSTWSAINIKKMNELIRDGRALPEGIKAFEMRTAKKSGIYSYEQREDATLDEQSENRFKEQAKAWKYFQAQAPWYRKTSIYWVVSAKKVETRKKRLAILIEACANGEAIPSLKRPEKTSR